jgi:hypothetical protein
VIALIFTTVMRPILPAHRTVSATLGTVELSPFLIERFPARHGRTRVEYEGHGRAVEPLASVGPAAARPARRPQVACPGWILALTCGKLWDVREA